MTPARILLMPDDEPLTAKLAYITRPGAGEFLFNVQVEGGEIARFTLTRDQLFNINADSANILVGESK